MSQATPRQIVKEILQGNTPERPLIVPIVFALGAKIENLPFRAYLENPTKITNALRQIRGQLRTDGVSCYFDPLLEVEAFGFSLREEANQVRSYEWPETAPKGKLPTGLRTPEAAASSARVVVAEDVIRRMKSLLRDEPLLMAGVSGPVTLAKRLIQVPPHEVLREEGEEIIALHPALELANEGIMRIASKFVEAGANLIFIREEFLPAISSDLWVRLQSLLAPVFNVIRFYEALPVLQVPGGPQIEANAQMILDQPSEAVLCSPSTELMTESARREGCIPLGISLPTEILQTRGGPGASFQLPNGAKPVMLTTDGDVPVTTDLKCLMAAFNVMRQGIENS